MLLIVLEYDLILVYKQKRSRETTFEIIEKSLENEKLKENSKIHLEICLNDNYINKQLQAMV